MDLQGLGVALITPFDATGAIDRAATERLVNYLLARDTDFFVVLGTTGETPTLSPEEQRAYLSHVIQLVGGRKPIVVGKSSNNTTRLVDELQTMDYTGVDYLLSAVPSYNKPNQEGIYQHFAAVAKAAQRPVLLYNVPGRTGVNMTAATTLRLAHAFPNIVGVKEASGDLKQINEILAGRPAGFEVLSGDDMLSFDMIRNGARGVISVIGNVAPRLFGDLIRETLEGKGTALNMKVSRLTEPLSPVQWAKFFCELLFEEGNPTGVKCAAAKLGLCENRLRLPLVPATPALEARIAEMLDEQREQL